MKGLILSGGKGTRLRPLTFTRAKQLIPIANKPNLFYGIDDLITAGITNIGVIISPDTGNEVVSAISEFYADTADFTYIVQDEPKGLAHAVMTARDFLDSDSFVMYLGDNLLSGGITHLVDEYNRGGSDGIVLLTQVENPSQFGVVVLGDDGSIKQLIEKPVNPPSNWALVGIYLFSPKIHDMTSKLSPSQRGEYEITDAIQNLVDDGYTVKAHKVDGWWKDTGKPEDLLDANRLVLSQIKSNVAGEVADSDLSGNIVIELGAKVINSSIRGPAHVASGAVVENSYIGPYTSIGKNCRITDSEVEFSILLNDAVICNIFGRIDASIIGMGAEVVGNSTRKNSIRFVLGDRSQITL